MPSHMSLATVLTQQSAAGFHLRVDAWTAIAFLGLGVDGADLHEQGVTTMLLAVGRVARRKTREGRHRVFRTSR